jgi:hypothetical protein
MFVLVEAHEESDPYKEQELWILLSDVYAAHTDLLALADDRRKLHAAELVVTAWNTQRGGGPNEIPDAPAFVVTLSSKLTEYRASFGANDAESHLKTGDLQEPEAVSADGMFAEGFFDFDMELQDIDWSFWSSID